MRLALFDLDHTLLPIDSDYEWSQFLVRLGVVDKDLHAERNQYFYDQYKAGKLDVFEFLDFQLAPLAAQDRQTLNQWHQQFMAQTIVPNLHDSARQLVRQHQDAGDLCAVVTATNAFVTRPIATEFGIEHLIATELEEADDGTGRRYTGKPLGTPSFREGKIIRTEQWLATLGYTFTSFDRSFFYSDSLNDIPLLQRVTDPVATNPDATLEAHAQAQGWRVLKLFA